MKGKGKQDILALMTFILSSKDCLGERKSMSNMQMSIGIGIGKGHHKAFLGWIGVGFKGMRLFPQFLHLSFITTQRIAFDRAFATTTNLQRCHFLLRTFT